MRFLRDISMEAEVPNGNAAAYRIPAPVTTMSPNQCKGRAKSVAMPGGSVIWAVGAELMTSMCLDDEARSIGECSGGWAVKGRVRPLRHKCQSWCS